MKERGLTQESLAAKAGVSRSAIGAYESAETRVVAIGIGSFNKIAAALGLNYIELVKKIGSPPPRKPSHPPEIGVGSEAKLYGLSEGQMVKVLLAAWRQLPGETKTRFAEGAKNGRKRAKA